MRRDPFENPEQQYTAQKSPLTREQASIADKDTTPLRAAPGGTQRTSYALQNTYQSLLKVPDTSLPDLTTELLASIFIAPEKATDHTSRTVKSMLSEGLERLQNPQPEGLHTRGVQAVRLGRRGLGMMPLLTLTNAVGLLLVSLAYYLRVLGYSYPLTEVCFFAGLLTIIGPNLLRLLSRTPTRLERLCLLGTLAVYAYFIQYMVSPLHFSGFDEFLHLRSVEDILGAAHLFTPNSMLPVSPYYPGLEIVTSAISTTTGLSPFFAGNILILASRLLMALALFLFYEHITSSSRMASLGVIIYMANQHFFFFDDAYSYETFALPLAVLMFYIIARFGNAEENYRWVIVTAWIVLIAVNLTHHMTSYFFDGLLISWTGISFFRPVSRAMRTNLLLLTIFSLLFGMDYAFLMPGNPVWSYLSTYFGTSIGQLEQIITGSSHTRPLFANTVQISPLWDRVLIACSVGIVTLSIPFGLLILQKLHRHNALVMTLGGASLLYPLTQAFRFTTLGVEITDRAASFLFLPIAYMITILIAHFWSTCRLNRGAMAFITGIFILILSGGVLVGSGPQLVVTPGPYLVVADNRSIEPEGIAAATWTLNYLGADQRVATDRINQMLGSTYGLDHIVTHLADGIDVSPIFYSTQFDRADRSLLQQGQIHYLVVDTRLSTALPLEETYFEEDRPTSIISRSSLTKFAIVPQINKLFDSGDIVIYDTGAFLNGPDG